jgi:HSP20 family protein
MDPLMRRGDGDRVMDDGPLSLAKAMNRLFERSFVSPSELLGFGGDLALDMYETDNEVVVKMSVPGVKPDELQVEVTGNELTIKGEARSEEGSKERNYIRRERRYGKFTRTVILPDYVQADKASAEFEHGVLALRLPKVEAAKARTIPVKAKAE